MFSQSHSLSCQRIDFTVLHLSVFELQYYKASTCLLHKHFLLFSSLLLNSVKYIFAQYLLSNQETQLAQKWKGRGLMKGAHISKETTVLQLLQSQHASSKRTLYILMCADKQSGQDSIVVLSQNHDQLELPCKMTQWRKRISILSVKLLRMLISVWYGKKIIFMYKHNKSSNVESKKDYILLKLQEAKNVNFNVKRNSDTDVFEQKENIISSVLSEELYSKYNQLINDDSCSQDN